MIPQHSHIITRPIAHPDAVVLAPHVRFTVLTARLIRIEHSATNQFEDHASQAFWHRRQAVPQFQVERSGDAIVITTEHLRLKYVVTDRGLSADTLSIQVFATDVTWKYGDRDRENLCGTARTLDMANGAIRLDPGLQSRAGWTVVDDSRTLAFNADGWLENRTDAGALDLYFFGYGRAYKECLRDFCKVAGQTPLIPRWALGNWWSRYWVYSQQELADLIAGFKQRDLPLAVCVVDMDWHITETGNASSGWTGYTWNRQLFPDPAHFLAWLHAQGLKVTLNLHPAEGIHPHEEQYAPMASALGIDPTTRKPVPFDIANPKFAQAYFEILHHPLEALGVDFWWIDWQQGAASRLAGLDPLWWLNHLHFYDSARDGTKRPFIFSRWGGLGNHRYPIGFSGDTFVTWDSLAFQPYFTATAANVGYGWWSHDIGGHQQGIEESELYVRWVQFGVFSPIFRLHSTNNPYHERRPWGRDAETLRIVRDAMQLRHALIPYLYSMAWRNHTQDLPLVAPMYYDYSEDADAYNCPSQYVFGSELIVAPITSPADDDTRLARQSVWLPRGDWFHFFTGEYLAGDRWRTVCAAPDEIPVFAKAGAIVPLAPKVGWGGMENPRELTIHIFPGADNRFELYEDDGETTASAQGRYCLTAFAQSWRGNELQFQIEPARGDASLIPSERIYHLVFHGIRSPEFVQATINDAPQDSATIYDERSETFTLEKIELKATDRLRVTLAVNDGALMSRRDRRSETCRAMLRAFKMPTGLKYRIDRDLPVIFENINRLSSYGAGIKDAHIAALKSVIELG